MKDIAIYGAGGFGREVACLINLINEASETKEWNLIGFFDDGKDVGASNEYGKFLGGIDICNSYESPLSVVLAIGSPNTIEAISSKITNSNIDFPNLIAPNTIFLDSANISLGKGNIICMGCLISTNVKIGNFNCFNGFITVGHDVAIGNYNSIMPATRISGNIQIGNRNFFGVSSVILPGIKIGTGTTIGAGSVVMRKTKDGNTYVGNPAIIIKY